MKLRQNSGIGKVYVVIDDSGFRYSGIFYRRQDAQSILTSVLKVPYYACRNPRICEGSVAWEEEHNE